MSKIGYNKEDCQKMVKSVERNGNQMVGFETVKYYQEHVIDELCKGWITKHGKDYIDNTIVVRLNEDLKKLAAALQQYADYMEQVAAKVAQDADDSDPYVKVNPKIVCGNFNSNNSKADINGTHMLDNEKLDNAEKKITQYIENRLQQNHDDIVGDWEKYREAFSKDGSSLANEWKSNFNSVYKSTIKDLKEFQVELNRVIRSKKADTRKARSEMEKVKTAANQMNL